MLPVFVRRIGNGWIRWVLRDAIGQSWTGTGWTGERSEALLFHSELDAIEARNRLGFRGDAADTFVAHVVLTVHRGKWTAEELRAYLKRHRRSWLRGSGGRLGILLELLPDGLKKVEQPAEEGNGPD
jgi:hypothetical protein